MNRADFDAEDGDFLREVNVALSANRERIGICPTPDLLMAARSGVAFAGSEDVQRHAALCPICTQLSRDLEGYEFPATTDDEDRRIRAKWAAAAVQSRPRWSGAWRLTWATVGIAAAVIAAILIMRSNSPSSSPTPRVVAQENTPPTPRKTDAFTLTKAAIKIPASIVLTFRGDAGRAQAYLSDLAAALEPYRKDDYAEAVRRLAVVAQKYPNAAEPDFYEGVSQLFLNQSERAVETLQAARAHTGDALRDDVSWYLSIGLVRSGRLADARREIETLCARYGEYKDRACTAVNAMR